METRTDRAEATLAAIVDTALAMAAAEGLESLSIGEVAKRLGLSKSGVFSRVGSREQLQVAVLLEYDRRFQQSVFVPAMSLPRGLPRLDAIMRRWLARATNADRTLSCLYTAGAFEYDDREGPVRDQLEDGVLRLRAALRRTVLQAVEAGHLRADLDVEQFVFEMDALFTGLLRDTRFLRDPRVHERGIKAWERMLAAAKTQDTPH
jgi:AcrR family transcriptional regulator